VPVSPLSSVARRETRPALIRRPRLRRLARSESTLLSAPWLAWLALFYAMPLGFVVVVSFWRTEGERMVPAFTLQNYDAIFTTVSGQLGILWHTLLIALIVVAASTLVAYPMAYFLAFRVQRLWMKSAILTLIVLPFLLGGLIRTIAWRGVLGVRGVVNEALQAIGLIDHPLDWLLYTKFSVALALFYNFYPFMLFTVYLVLEAVDRRIITAALDLGASRWQTFWHVVFPLSVPGLLTGSILIFVPVASASLEPEILGGPSGRFTANAVQAKFFVAFDWPAGAAMAVIFTIASLAVIAALVGVLGIRFRRVFAGFAR
jgi:spermidine/putrescine transport system permease protein